MDNLSAGTRFLPLVQKKKRTSQLPSTAFAAGFDSDMSYIDSDVGQKLDGFPPESLDALRRNYWMDSFGISGCFRSESLSEMRRNTQLWRYRVVQNAIGFIKDADLRLVYNVRLHFIASCLQLVTFLLDAATLWMLIRSLGAKAPLSHVFASFMIANLVRTVSFIPGGLGTFEAAAVLMLKIDGVSVAVGLSTALLFRGLTFFLPMAPGLWFSRRINKHRFS